MSAGQPAPGGIGALLLAGALAAAPAPFTDLTRLRYNHPGLVVDLGVGLWAAPLPMDYDGDGDLDLVVVCSGKPYNGTYVFETASDDGSRMWIDLDHDEALEPEELLINGWGIGQGVSVRERTLGMPAGTYRIRIQYYDLWAGNEFYLVSSTWMPGAFVPSAGITMPTTRPR